jgi:phospholipid/cholesterol/gamma-HCH transport system ATP-binding protein
MATKRSNTDEIIKWDTVYKSFGDHEVLGGLSLSVREGETLTIIGGSGSGKSVMLKILLGLMKLDSGGVFYQNEDVCHMDEEELVATRRQVGMLFQGGALFDSLTVGENVAYPLREHFKYSEDKINEIVRHKLSLIGLPGIENMKPSDLSGGMKKRVALARAIATEPKVILYDEPTTGLDPANTMRINHLIRDLQEKIKVTSIAVTHDMESAFFISDRIAMLYNQKIEFVGSPSEARRSTNMVVQNFIKGQVGDDEKIVG